ncbi:hypothetical protein MPH_09500 [Macrophomina phaseolina MS6]|uniref:Uncharacterized protein n=1 Tax=Macrophomina phaseolina (strain MS6) TaxID=1126212 RepID=K2S8M8_MACPH|nr:hypothetical protein MPH_09500 [Macrophomina phaseolina MS6]
MKRPARRIKLLTGAPDAAKLSWDESALLDDWTPVVRRFLKRKFDADEEERGEENDEGGAMATASRWRSIPASSHAHLHTGYTQESPVRQDFAGAEYSLAVSSQASTTYGGSGDDDDAEGANTTEQRQGDDGDEDDTHFLEHSIAVHDDTRSSQLAAAADDSATSLLVSFHSITTTSSQSPSRPDDSYAADERARPPCPLPRTLTSLRALPTAAHLHRIAPQTIVVSLLVGVIALLPARPIRTRHGAVRDLVEVLVGDDSATGFKISFWFAHEEEGGGASAARRGTAGDDPLREALRNVRVRDVVLVENVALDTFREKVFGYALRRSMQRNQTRVQLVARDGLDRVDVGAAGAERVAAMKEWVWGLVNTPGLGRRDGRGEEGEDEALPPDTQE